jgi:hypothetical protein
MIDVERFKQNFEIYQAQQAREAEERQAKHRQLAALCCLSGYSQGGVYNGQLSIVNDRGESVSGPVDEVLFCLVDD